VHDVSTGGDACNGNSIAVAELRENLLIAVSFPLYGRNNNSVNNNAPVLQLYRLRCRCIMLSVLYGMTGFVLYSSVCAEGRSE
jgi:hypothetical protein